MKKNIIKYIFFGLTLLFGFFAWFSIYRAIKISEASTWAVPMILFSLYMISICLMVVLARREIAVEIVALISLLPSIFFAFSIWHFMILLVCASILLCALHNIRKDLDLNVKINLWKSLGTGKFKIIFALALLISSQYFFILKSIDGKKIIPRFDISAISSKMVEPILISLDPNFKKMQGSNGISVDQFLIETKGDIINDIKIREENASEYQLLYDQIPPDLPPKEKELLKQQIKEQISGSKMQTSEATTKAANEAYLKESRKTLSEMVGKDLQGNEKISEVFTGFIDKKINDFFQYKIANDSQPSLLEYIFTAVLFFTIWPLGSILGSLCFVIIVLLFKIFVYFELIKIEKAMIEREVIV